MDYRHSAGRCWDPIFGRQVSVSTRRDVNLKISVWHNWRTNTGLVNPCCGYYYDYDCDCDYDYSYGYGYGYGYGYDYDYDYGYGYRLGLGVCLQNFCILFKPVTY